MRKIIEKIIAICIIMIIFLTLMFILPLYLILEVGEWIRRR